MAPEQQDRPRFQQATLKEVASPIHRFDHTRPQQVMAWPGQDFLRILNTKHLWAASLFPVLSICTFDYLPTNSTACLAFCGLYLTQTHTLTLGSPYQNGSQSPAGFSGRRVNTVPGYKMTLTGHSPDLTGHTLPLTASLTMASAGSVGVGAIVDVDEGRRVGVVVGIEVGVVDRASVGVTVGRGVDVSGTSVSVGNGDGVAVGGDVGEVGKTIVLVGAW